uniref:Uncharacterized protein n=1 Tax=Glossina austeni TaxID=7395 RepID=A0A1A9VGK9_GLOAU
MFTYDHIHVDFNIWNSLENHASDEGVPICEKLVRKLRLKYNPNMLSVSEMDHPKLLALAVNQKFITLDTIIAALLSKFEDIFGEEAEPAKKRAASNWSLVNTKSKAPNLVVEDLNKKYDVIKMMKFYIKNCAKCWLMAFSAKIKQSFSRHSLGYLKLSLGAGLALLAQYFNYLQKDKKPRKILVQRSDNALVKCKRLHVKSNQNLPLRQTFKKKIKRKKIVFVCISAGAF